MPYLPQEKNSSEVRMEYLISPFESEQGHHANVVQWIGQSIPNAFISVRVRAMAPLYESLN